MNSRIAVRAAVLGLSALLCLGGDSEAASKKIRLRINDADATAGSLVAVVVRTYSPRPISQGQISIRTKKRRRARDTRDWGLVQVGPQMDRPADGRAGAQRAPVVPFLTLEGFEVFSREGDAESVANLVTTGKTQTLQIDFSSASASINRSDGPLAVLYLRVADSLRAGQEFELTVDVTDTAVADPAGQSIRVVPRNGLLRVRRPRAAPKIDIEGASVEPGETAEIAVRTFEPIAMSGGTVAVRYNRNVIRATPSVRMNRKYGTRKFSVDTAVPGVVMVTFESRDSSWNLVPGDIFELRLPTSQSAPANSTSPVTFDPSMTALFGADGSPLGYDLRDGSIRFGESDDDDTNVRFKANVVSVSGQRLNLSDGVTVVVDNATTWDPEGDLTSLAAVADALSMGKTIEVKGRGPLQPDGSVLAKKIEAETDDDDDGGGTQFKADVVSVSGQRMTLTDGAVVEVDGTTAWDPEGDLTTLAAVASAVSAGTTVEVEGEGQPQADGSILAATIKAETDDGGGNGGTEFEADVASVTGQRMTLNDGVVVAVDGSTVWDPEGDLTALAAVADAVGAGTTVEVEGEGQPQADGSILATEIKAETDDGEGGGTEFEADVASVTGQRMTLTDGAVVHVDGSTVWDPEGDLTTLAAVADAVGAGTTVEVKGKGQPQADGSILATEIKAETDDG